MKLDVFKTGISDHHKMIFSVLRKTFSKDKRKIVFYCCYKKHDQNSFKEALQNKILQLSFEEFREIFQLTLEAFAPYKQKKIKYNNKSFMTKSLRTEIITSKLLNSFNKSRTRLNWQNHKKQSNKCVKALKHAKNNTLTT